MTNKKDTGEQKRKVSVALEYVPGEEAPKIIASGKGVLAEKIIERAKEADVPVYEDSQACQYAFQAGNRRYDTAGIIQRGCRDSGLCR